MRIDMFVYNRCTTDARVLKEARTLTEAGHRVRVVAVLDAETEAEEERDGFRIVRIDRNPVHYRLLKAMRIVAGVLRRRLGRGDGRPAERAGGVGVAGSGGGRGAPDTRGAPADAGPMGEAAELAWLGLRRLLLAPHKPLMFWDYYRRAYQLVRADPPGALHAHDLNTLPVAAVLARRLGLPLTYDAHELYPEISTLSRREAAVWRFLEARLAPRADHVLTVCESIAEEMATRYGIPRPTVLLNVPTVGAGAGGPDEGRAEGQRRDEERAKARRAEAGQALRALAGLGEGREPIVLYQGGFAPHRGLATLVRAAHDLEQGTVVLMGWGRLEDDLRALISAEGLGGRVKLTGPVPQKEVVAHAAGAAVGVIPYEPVGLNNTYTTPNKLFDYMAAGLPIAASRLPELTRFVEGERIGLTVTPGDPAALATTLNELLADPERLNQMRGRALAAARRYTWERESAKLPALYRTE